MTLKTVPIPPDRRQWRVALMRGLAAPSLIAVGIENSDFKAYCEVDVQHDGVTFHHCDEHDVLLVPEVIANG